MLHYHLAAVHVAPDGEAFFEDSDFTALPTKLCCGHHTP